MKSATRPLSGLAGLLALAAAPAPAQEVRRLDPVVVNGTRQSLESAQARKREAPGILDAIVAEDVHRLPDPSVADALQRVTGVQVGRDRGEGSTVAVRGLLQVETTLNGREVFSAGTGRTLDFADLAAETLAGIDVHKTSAADRIEGGLGGSIDLRTLRPFDFRSDTQRLTARAVHGDLSGGAAGQASGLAVRRWRMGDGEVGALINVVLQERRWREDQKGSGAPKVCSDRTLKPNACAFDLVPGQDVVVPNGTSETSSTGRRRRTGGSAIVEWRPSPAWDVYAEAHLAEFRTAQNSDQINVGTGTGFVPGSVALFPGTNDLQRISWTNAPVSILSFARDTLDRSKQFAVGTRWRGERLEIDTDASHAHSRNHLYFAGPILAATAAQFTHDLSGSVPATQVSGTDLADPTQVRYSGYAYRTRPFEGSLDALRVDGRWSFAGLPLEEIAFGWRHAQREADNQPGLVFGDAGITGLTAADTPDRVHLNPVGNFLDGAAPSVGGYLVGSLADARDAAAARAALGLTTQLPVAAGPLSLWRIRERTDAVFAQARARWPQWRLDGQAGLRMVRTQRVTDSAQTVTGSGTIDPITLRDTSTDTLPSASLRWRQTPDLHWRAAASRTLTRPDFNQLSPSLVLTPNPVNPELNQGFAGNPALRPLRANNLDLAVERAWDRGRAASLAVFWKRVDGFIATLSQAEEHGGQVYQVSRPRNADKGRVRGAEMAWQGFFDALPGAWRGLGAQLNYTYVDSRTFDRTLGREVPLPNLSRHSANLIGLYELGPWSARLAWNWRSRFFSGATSVVGIGGIEAWTAGHGWLDASLRWRLSPRVSLAFDAVNLTGTVRRSDFNAASRPQNAFANDRQFATSVSVQF
jgi:TonB-dependent receptor